MNTDNNVMTVVVTFHNKQVMKFIADEMLFENEIEEHLAHSCDTVIGICCGCPIIGTLLLFIGHRRQK